MYICPICKSKLFRVDNSYKCENNHSYDIASSGYVNLLNPGKKNNFKAGDSKEMVRARTAFFESGAYKQVSDKLCSIIEGVKNDVIVDAGCGEGYYSLNIAKKLTHSLVFGFDMTKFGCEHASKAARRLEITSSHFSVANIFDLPLENEVADVVISLFAPVADKEFHRILKPGGHLIVACAGVYHLNGLKEVLYDNLYLNEEKQATYDNFVLVDTINLKYSSTIIGNDTIKNLFTMTPYYHRTSLEDKKKLDSVTNLETDIDVNFLIYKKQAN